MVNEVNQLETNLKKGKICTFETDTVVGIGCSLFYGNPPTQNKNGIRKIFKIKNRPINKPLPWLISSTDMMNKYVKLIPNWSYNYIQKFWPGNTTLIFSCLDSVDKKLTIDNSIAFRIPDSKYLRNIISSVGFPILTTSANISGETSTTKIENVSKKILSFSDYIENKHINLNVNAQPSQIIDCTGSNPLIVRK